jgi:hypothetical protein
MRAIARGERESARSSESDTRPPGDGTSLPRQSICQVTSQTRPFVDVGLRSLLSDVRPVGGVSGDGRGRRMMSTVVDDRGESSQFPAAGSQFPVIHYWRPARTQVTGNWQLVAGNGMRSLFLMEGGEKIRAGRADRGQQACAERDDREEQDGGAE